jgi:hypothetical protein
VEVANGREATFSPEILDPLNLRVLFSLKYVCDFWHFSCSTLFDSELIEPLWNSESFEVLNCLLPDTVPGSILLLIFILVEVAV